MKLVSILFAGTLAISTAQAQQKLDVQAHRGGRALMPENTIPAMLHAVDLGVQTLELDCVISADKKVVVSHDVYMSADFMRKPDGTDIEKAHEKEYALYKMNYDSIRRFDAGSKPYPQFPDQVRMKTYKPLLSALIDSVERYVKVHKLKPVNYNMETKISPDGDDLFHPKPEEFVKLMMSVIRSKGIAKRVTIQSFDPRTLVLVHRDYPEMKTALLISNTLGFDANIKDLGFTPAIYSPYYLQVNADLVKQAHAKGVKVLPWTVNSEKDMQAQAALGVDGMITDEPEKMVKLLGSYQFR